MFPIHMLFPLSFLAVVLLAPLPATSLERHAPQHDNARIYLAAGHDGHGSGHGAGREQQPSAAQADDARVHTATGIFESGEEGGKVTITHDPIPALNWPKMTMRFALETPALAEGLKKGDKVRLDFRAGRDGTLRILHLEPVR